MSKTMPYDRGNTLFNVTATVLLCLVLIIVAYPLYFVVIASFSDATAVTTGKVWFWPKEFTLTSYARVFAREDLRRGFLNSTIYSSGSVIVGLFLVMTTAFPLSFKHLPHKKGIMRIYLVVMYFGGGLVPSYMWIRKLGLINNPILIILLASFSVYHVIITISFLNSTIPETLYEATEIDGGSYLSMFMHITIPLSKAIMAVLTLYIAVGQWNSYYTPMIYLNSQKYRPLALVLRSILQAVTDTNAAALDTNTHMAQVTLAEQLKYAVIVVASVPIILLYPFIQRYFIQGVMIGAIKG